MPKRDDLKFQGGAATNAEGEQGSQGGKNHDHAHNAMAATQKSLGFLRNFGVLRGTGLGPQPAADIDP